MQIMKVVCVIALCLSVVTQAQFNNVYAVSSDTTSSMNENMKLWYTKPATIDTAETSSGEWMRESLALGNGTLGNLIFGGISKERIHFNEKTLWTGGPTANNPNYKFGNIKYTNEEIEEYRQVLDDKSTNVFNDTHGLGYSDFRFRGGDWNMGTYQDFGDIWVDYSPMGITDKNVSNYRRKLDLQTGIASTQFTYRNVKYTREHFVSYPDNVMVTKLNASKAEKLSVDVSMVLNNGGFAATTTLNTTNHTVTIDGYIKDNGLKFRTTMQLVLEGGKIQADEDNKVYHITNADSVMIVMAAESNYKDNYPVYRDTEKNLAQVVDGRVNQCSQKGYEKLKQNHLDDHQVLFDRVELDLGECLPNIPTNQLMDEYRKGNYSTYTEVLAFQFGRYLSIAGSRGVLPSNLVGLWTVGPSAWSGDYHFNVNLEMNYWPVYVTNLAECGTTLINYMDSLRAPGELTAEMVHGITDATKNHNAFTFHTQSNIFGMTSPSGTQEYGWNPSGAAWMMQNVWQYYEFTQDEAYLKEVIYPIMKEATQFWDAYLWESNYQKIDDETSPYNGQNRVVVAPSVSAEQGPTVNGSTYDQSLVWELYKESIAAGKIVGEDEALLKKWEETMQKLDPININQTGGIKEWYEETRVGTESGHNHSYAKAGNLAEVSVPNSGWNIGHPGEQRHASHLVGLFPGTLINKDNPEYLNAAIQSLEERGVYSTGWSKANKVNLWARAGNGDKAYILLNNLIGGNSSGLQYNLFDSHGSGGGETMKNGSPIWQIDGNYGLTSGVAEMLIQSQLGYTQFLPAIPKAWENGSVTGLKARGNFTIGETWKNGLATMFTVAYDGDQESSLFTGEYKNIKNAVVYDEKGNTVKTAINEKGQITFEAEKGKTYTIDMLDIDRDILLKKANACLKALHPDLSVVKAELEKAIADNSSKLADILQKAQMMNEVYKELLENEENVYYMTSLDVNIDDIDSMYYKIKEVKRALLENTQNVTYYRNASTTLKGIYALMNQQMDNRVISFSKESGLISSGDTSLTLSKSADAKNYVIRYTLDGSEPCKTSSLYEKAITLNPSENTIVRAALFFNDQRVSPIYDRQYIIKGVHFDEVKTSWESVWGGYEKEKMIDGNNGTRWASMSPSTQEDMEIILNSNEKQTINKLYFDIFVSHRNGINGYEIQALNDEGIYETVCQGAKLADGDDDAGGNHGYKMIDIPEVTTSSLKFIIKAGFIGEPSIWEIKAFDFADIVDGEGDPTNIKEMIALCENVDRESSNYKEATLNLRNAFEESILDAKVYKGLTQSMLDTKLEFLSSRYQRLGFGEIDKSVLAQLIAEAEAIDPKLYTRDSLYPFYKELAKAKDIYNDENASQPIIDREVGLLQRFMDQLEEARYSEVNVPSTDLENHGSWFLAGKFMATDSNSAGKLTYTFTGLGISVKTVNGDDHGVIRVIITDESNQEVYKEDIDTFASSRVEGVTLMETELESGTYTISFERVGPSSQNPSKRGWVEVGEMSIKRPFEETVDRSSLEAEIEKCEALHENQYTEQSWKNFKDVLDKARVISQKKDEDTCTAEMEDWSEQLQQARLALVEKMDISELQKTLAEAKAVQEGDYSKESYASLQQAILEVECFLNGSYNQEEVYAKTAMLKQKLSELTVDKAELEKAIEETKVLNEKNYTEASWKTFKTVLENSEKMLTGEVKQSVIDQQVILLKEAVENLQYRGADYSAVDQAIARANALNKDDYKDFSAVEAAIKAVVRDLDMTKQAEVDAMAKAINGAIDALEKKDPIDTDVDKLALQIAVNVAKEVTHEDLKDVVKAVVEEFKAALTEAENILADANATQAQVDASFKRLADAMHMLSFKKVDMSSLQRLVDSVKGCQKEDYYENTWTPFESALAKAIEVLADENQMDQDLVNEAFINLAHAYLALRMIPDKSKLDELINQANALDASKYTAASYKLVKQAVAKANALVEPEQVEVDAVVAELEAVLKGLVVNKAEEPTKPADKDGDKVAIPDTDKKAPADKEDTNKVQTADNTAIALFASMMFVSMAVVCLFKKKEN